MLGACLPARALAAMIRVRVLRDFGQPNTHVGDVVEVAAGYGKSYLIRNGFAEEVKAAAEKHAWEPVELSAVDAVDKAVVVREFRRQMYVGGERKWSIQGLNRVFDQVTTRRDGTIDAREFHEALSKFGVFLSAQAESTLFRSFSKSGAERLLAQEFITGLRGPMGERRYSIVHKAWLSASKPGPAGAPVAAWSAQGSPTDEAGFMDHFTDLSAGVDSDEIFVNMICAQFRVSEKDADAEVQAMLAGFKRQLLDKLEQKSFSGAGAQGTLLKAFQYVTSSSAIGRGEFRSALEIFGFRGKTVDDVFDLFDTDRSGKIEYKEFVTAMAG